MKTYARIQDGRVAELFRTDADMRQLFHPSLVWVEVAAQYLVNVGWTFDGLAFNPPAELLRLEVTGATLSELQRQLALLSAQFAALAHH